MTQSPAPPPPLSEPAAFSPVPPSLPCGGLTEGVFPDPPAPSPSPAPPPPDPPFKPTLYVAGAAPPAPPPPADIIVENTEFVPEQPCAETPGLQGATPAPPAPPTVTVSD